AARNSLTSLRRPAILQVRKRSRRRMEIQPSHSPSQARVNKATSQWAKVRPQERSSKNKAISPAQNPTVRKTFQKKAATSRSRNLEKVNRTTSRREKTRREEKSHNRARSPAQNPTVRRTFQKKAATSQSRSPVRVNRVTSRKGKARRQERKNNKAAS